MLSIRTVTLWSEDDACGLEIKGDLEDRAIKRTLQTDIDQGARC